MPSNQRGRSHVTCQGKESGWSLSSSTQQAHALLNSQTDGDFGGKNAQVDTLEYDPPDPLSTNLEYSFGFKNLLRSKQKQELTKYNTMWLRETTRTLPLVLAKSSVTSPADVLTQTPF